MADRKALTATELSQKIWTALELEVGSRHVHSATALRALEMVHARIRQDMNDDAKLRRGGKRRRPS